MIVNHAAEFRRCLIELDVKGIRALWRHVSPGLPQPATDDEALHMLHLAREQAKSVPLVLRQYSRRWLDERRSGKIACGVFIAVKATAPHRQAEACEVRQAMESAVLDAYRAGVDLDQESGEVSLRMRQARQRLYRS